ncbi:MAG: hypothetical protein AAF939_03085, partial [Planctomycetota bacterium]
PVTNSGFFRGRLLGRGLARGRFGGFGPGFSGVGSGGGIGGAGLGRILALGGLAGGIVAISDDDSGDSSPTN